MKPYPQYCNSRDCLYPNGDCSQCAELPKIREYQAQQETRFRLIDQMHEAGWKPDKSGLRIASPEGVGFEVNGREHKYAVALVQQSARFADCGHVSKTYFGYKPGWACNGCGLTERE